MRVRRLSRLVSVAPVVLAVLALGCVAAPRVSTDRAQPARSAGARPGRSTPAPTTSTAGAARADGTNTVEEFRQDMSTARRYAELYWDGQFARRGVRFRPIRTLVAYTRDGEAQCGDEPIGANNAAYCSAGDFIAYDIAWAYGAFQQVGDAFIYYLLGHEYAHAIQLRLGIRKEFTIQQELQADCMAGAYLGDEQRAGKLTVQDSDIEEFRQGLAAVGDDPGQPWFAPGSHGTAEQRTRAFVNGYQRSLGPCNLS